MANSLSIAARSSRSRSKTSFAVAMEIVLTHKSEYQGCESKSPLQGKGRRAQRLREDSGQVWKQG